MKDRTGTSYPYVGIAQDYGIPYATVLHYADSVAAGYALGTMRVGSFPIWQMRAQIEVDGALAGDRRTAFHAAVRAQVDWMAAQHATKHAA